MQKKPLIFTVLIISISLVLFVLLFLAVVLPFLFFKSKPISKNPISTGESVGYFNKVECGDYCHLYITNLDGEEESYFIHDNTDKSINIYSYQNNSELIGKKIRVTWQEIKTFIPEGGDEYTITELLTLEQLN